MTLKIGRGAAAPPFIVMDVIAAANARQATLPAGAPRVIRMEVGQPGTGAPAGAVTAAQAALRSGAPLGYTEAFGRISLRERIVEHIRSWYGLDVPTARIAVTVGASGAFPLAFLAAFDPGDRVALAAPYYPPYVNIATALGLKTQLLVCGPETGFQPSTAMLQALDPQPDALLVASPANPTGSMLAPDDLAALAIYCDGAGIRLISDEIYHGLTYGKPAASAAQFSDSAIVINSFSKYFSMTGWRVGWMVLPEDLVRLTERRLQEFFAAGRRVLRLSRHRQPRPRQRHLLRPAVGRSRHRRHHRPGFRPDPRRQFFSPQLLRAAGGYRGSDQPAAKAGAIRKKLLF